MDRDVAAGVATDAAADDTAAAVDGRDSMGMFAVLWAVATLFHVWGPSGRAFQLFDQHTTVGLFQAVAGAVAVAVIVRPRSLPLFGALAVLGPVTLWFEAPVLGSHWVVASLVDVAFLLSLFAGRFAADRVAALFLPLARWVLIGFYAFAAFAKLNHAFFTPSVSCGTYYLDELANSLHLSLNTATGGGWSHLVPFGVAATELSIPFLLLMRRTRHLGVLVGLVFHGLIALDQTHLFSDFSSVLVALFLLFLPFGFARDVMARLDERVRIGAAAICAVMLIIQWRQGETRLFRDALGWAWVVFDVAVVAAVVLFLRRRPEPLAGPLRFAARAPRWLVIVPLLVVLNGLSPYLELRTAYAFNMYSNLQTAGGDSNHLLIARTLPLTNYEYDLVRITATDDPNLQVYIGQFDIPFLQLREYLSRNQSVSLTYRRDGAEHSVLRASDDPALVEPVPSWQSKLFAFRSIDQSPPADCQPFFYAAL